MPTAHSLPCDSPEMTADLAASIGAICTAGDVLLLSGPVGAGKTHFARALIQSLLIVPEDVPSPTFTLVQTYEGRRGPIWHADLYRLHGPDEIHELGLADAFHEALCLVEWPDRLGALTPAHALRIEFDTAAHPQRRIVTLHTGAAAWAQRLAGLEEPWRW